MALIFTCYRFTTDPADVKRYHEIQLERGCWMKSCLWVLWDSLYVGSSAGLTCLFRKLSENRTDALPKQPFESTIHLIFSEVRNNHKVNIYCISHLLSQPTQARRHICTAVLKSWLGWIYSVLKEMENKHSMSLSIWFILYKNLDVSVF